MKKALTTYSAAALIFISSTLPYNNALVHAASSTESLPTASVSQGMSGSMVTALQTNLKTLGYFTYPLITGYYGKITAQAVSSFQQAYGLPVSGQADTRTQTAIAHAVIKQQIVKDTSNYLQIPYVWGGSTPAGFDCSGFVYYMFSQHGVALERTTSAVMAGMGNPVDRNQLQPGDWVFFGLNEPGVVSHMGIYTGNGEFISATRSKGIYVQELNNSYWGPKYISAKRYY